MSKEKKSDLGPWSRADIGFHSRTLEKPETLPRAATPSRPLFTGEAAEPLPGDEEDLVAAAMAEGQGKWG